MGGTVALLWAAVALLAAAIVAALVLGWTCASRRGCSRRVQWLGRKAAGEGGRSLPGTGRLEAGNMAPEEPAALQEPEGQETPSLLSGWIQRLLWLVIGVSLALALLAVRALFQ
ncbi:MAG: hypothetical protein IMW99_03990 [Firmicutes bacterium]|nr:hypothetical protein [Bacillota bacterium]